MVAYSKGAKRREKKDRRARQGVETLYDQWKREAVEFQQREDPLATVREARQRLYPWCKDPLDIRMCEQAGIAINLGAKDAEEASRLWGLFKRYDAAEERFARLVIGRPRFPNVAKMEFLPERLETRADDRVDLRTMDEKVDAARKAMNEWGQMLSRMRPYERIAIRRAARQEDRLEREGSLTTAGMTFVHALRMLAAIEG